MIYVFVLLAAAGVIAALFLNLHPVFGGNLDKEQQERYRKFENYNNGKFVNQVPTKMDMGVSEYFSMIKDSIVGAKDRNPAGKLPVSVIDWGKINSVEDSLT